MTKDDSNETEITTYLEMNDPAELRPKRVDVAELEIRQVLAVAPEFSWFLHEAVGADFSWGGRVDWGREEWMAYLDRPELETWVAYVGGAPAGFFDIEKQTDGGVEIRNLGLLARHFGQGIGGHLVTEAVARAWTIGANRVWLHTCTHDHEHALANYLARGFQIVKEIEEPANRPRKSALFSKPNFA
jgi:ribosomal protein S18 acetylase RimI-like enzyme